MNHRVRQRVFRHILDWCGAGEENLPPNIELLPVSLQIREVLRAALLARYGPIEGLKAFGDLEWRE